jgi:hypothetical protein
VLVMDADRTLTAEETGTMLWKASLQLSDCKTGVGIRKADATIDTSNFDGVYIEHSGDPPKYADILHLQSSSEHVVRVLQDWHKRGNLGEVASGHQIIVMDDNFRLSKALKKIT